MEFNVLGPLEVGHHGAPVVVGAAMQRRLLVALLCRAGSTVPVPELIEVLWPEAVPPTARKTVQVYVRRLRLVLGADRLRHTPPGYLVLVDPAELDAARFDELGHRARASRRAGRFDAAASLFDQALALWRGAPYAELAGAPLVIEEVGRLEEQRLLMLEERAAADLDRGRHAEVVPELVGLVSAYPYRERLRGYLMLALYRADRQSEALMAYQRGRAVLADEMGVEPGPTLQRLHRAVLRNDERLDRLPSAELGSRLVLGR